MSSLFYLVFNLTYLSIVPFVGLGDHKNMVLSNNNNKKCADNILREKKKEKALKPGPDKDEERKYKCLLAFSIVLIFYETFISSLLFLFNLSAASHMHASSQSPGKLAKKSYIFYIFLFKF